MKDVTISGTTRVPLLWLFAISAFLLVNSGGGIAWLTQMHSDVAQAKIDIAETKNDRKQDAKTLEGIERALIRIQTKLGIEPEPNGE